MIRFYTFLIVFVSFSQYIFSQNQYNVRFKSGIQYFEENSKDLDSILQLNPEEIYNGKIYYFAQFYNLPDFAQFNELK